MRPVPILVFLLAIVAGLVLYFSLESYSGSEGLNGPGEAVAPGAENVDTDLQAHQGSGSGAENTARVEVETQTEPEQPVAALNDLTEIDANELRGVVVDAANTPLAGCTVTFMDEASDKADLPLIERPQVVTGDDGRFSFLDLPPGDQHALMVRHSEIAQVRVSGVLVEDFGASELPPIILRYGKRVRGTVTNQFGLAIEGAQLHLDSRWNPGDPQPSVDRLTAVTDELGEYGILGVADGTRYLTVECEGFGTLTRIQSLIFSDATGPAHKVDFQLQSPAQMAGRVVDDSGNPVGGADVVAVDRSAYFLVPHSRTVTAADGSFEMPRLQGGTYQVLFRAQGYNPGVRTEVATPQQELELVLETHVTFSGVLTVPGGGQLPSQFSLRLRAKSSDSSPSVPREPFQEVRGASAGAFVLSVRKPRGSFVIEVRAEGFAPSYSPLIDNDGGGSVAGIQIALTRGATIRGRLVDSSGAAVHGGRIASRDDTWSDDPMMAALGDFFASEATVAHARSDKMGLFALENLSAATYQVVARSANLHQVSVHSLLVEAQGDLDIGDVVLLEGGNLHGALLDSQSARVVGGTVYLQPKNEGDGTSLRRAKSGVDGEWRIGNIVPGSYSLLGEAPTALDTGNAVFWPDAELGEPLQIASGMDDVRDVVLENWTVPVPAPPKPPTGTLGGTVSTSSGAANVGTHLRIEPVDPDAGLQPQICKSEREGAFVFLSVPPGEYDLLVVDHEESRKRVFIEADSWTLQNLSFDE
ncbi:MAG: hypothetical protein ACI8X5_000623 [Planctomycetota bacterium]|jgi:hypothetical protein